MNSENMVQCPLKHSEYERTHIFHWYEEQDDGRVNIESSQQFLLCCFYYKISGEDKATLTLTLSS